MASVRCKQLLLSSTILFIVEVLGIVSAQIQGMYNLSHRYSLTNGSQLISEGLTTKTVGEARDR